MLYLEFSEGVIAFALAFGVVIAVLASVWPAFLASKMQPADAVRAD
jgi:ABC-type antimicrobial peptide transport system permease subunit